jgi:Zn-dependent metalloprotease
MIFFQKMYKRNSVDGKGLPLTANIHYGKKFENAFWNGSEFCIGDGGQTLKNLFEIDIIANEFSVGVFQYSANLNIGVKQAPYFDHAAMYSHHLQSNTATMKTCSRLHGL